MSNDTNNPAGNSTRRKFLGMAGLMGAGAVLAGCTNVGAVETIRTNYDVKIGNFALNLEYLEAAFYLAAVGRINELKAIGGSAAIILPSGFDGTTSIPFKDQAVAQYAQDLAAVDRPVIDIGPAFTAAANAAAGATLSPSFNPYLNDLFFLHGAFIFEDVGVTAYKGAARLIVDYSEGGILDSAAGILAVEAYHAGEIRTLLYAQKDAVTPYGVTVEQLIQKISDLRAKVGGGKDEGLTKNGKANIVVADANSVAYGRSPREVLNIVYLGAGASKGGFFPNGLNGDFSGLV